MVRWLQGLVLLVVLLHWSAAAEDLPPVIDLHCDSLTQLEKNSGTDIVDTRDPISLRNLKAGGVMAQVFAIWVNPKRGRSVQIARRQVAAFEDKVIRAGRGMIRQARSYADILENHRAGVISAVLAMEGADGLGVNASNLEWFTKRGLRILSLTWNNSNVFADGLRCPDPPPRGGLTEEGARLLGIMAANLVIVDLSHAHWETFWDIVTRIPGPVIATHSNARSIRDHDRNLDDEQIVAIAQKQGVIGLVYYYEFVAEGKRVTATDLWAHYRYISEIVGPEFIALGSDFGSRKMKLIQGVSNPGEVLDLLRTFRRQGVGDLDLDLLASMNALRVIHTADEEYFDIAPLNWRPLRGRPIHPADSSPALYDRLRSTAVTLCEPGMSYEFQTDGTDLFAVVLRTLSDNNPAGASINVLVQVSTCQDDIIQREFTCPMDGSRCVMEVFKDLATAGACTSHVRVRLEPQGDNPPGCWKVQDIIPLQRVVHR